MKRELWRTRKPRRDCDWGFRQGPRSSFLLLERRGSGCFGGDFGDDAATLARAAAWQRENPELAEKQAEFFHRLRLDPGGVVAKEELLALSLSPDYRLECDICDRNYMLRRGCPCCRD